MAEQNKSSRRSIIQTVQTPLGFFVLVVLIVEIILGVLASSSEGNDRTYMVVGMLGLMFVLVIIVGLLAAFRPYALLGRSATNVEVRIAPTYNIVAINLEFCWMMEGFSRS